LVVVLGPKVFPEKWLRISHHAAHNKEAQFPTATKPSVIKLNLIKINDTIRMCVRAVPQ
jgi:hypothetical protein